MARGTLLVALAYVLLIGSSAGAATSLESVSFRVEGRHTIIGIDSTCPDGLSRVKLVSSAGARLGYSRHCVLEVSKTERVGYAVGSVSERVLEWDVLPAGTIVSETVYLFRWLDRAGSLALVHASGRVVGGTGQYQDARGRVSGWGIQRDGRQRLAIAVRLV